MYTSLQNWRTSYAQEIPNWKLTSPGENHSTLKKATESSSETCTPVYKTEGRRMLKRSQTENLPPPGKINLPWKRRLKVLPKHVHLSTKLKDVVCSRDPKLKSYLPGENQILSIVYSSVLLRLHQPWKYTVWGFVTLENYIKGGCVWTCKINYSLSHNYAATKYASDRRTLPATCKGIPYPPI